MEGKPLIKLYKTCGQHYLYDANKNSILQISKSIYDHLSGVNQQKTKNDEELLNRMSSAGFLTSNRVKEILHPITDLLPFYLSNKLSKLTLQITQKCNLQCKYCVYSGKYKNRSHTNKSMPLNIAIKAIDFFIEHSIGSPEIFVSFYGGEPILELDLIKECVSYIKIKSEGKRVNYSLTTNGTLLNRKAVEYFVENDFGILISLDGPKEIHNKERVYAFNGNGTFDTIIKNIENIKVFYPQYLSKVNFCTVLNPSCDIKCVDDFFVNYETIKNIKNIFTSLSDRYTNEKFNYSNEFFVYMEYELFKVYLYKLHRISYKNVSKIALRLFQQLEKLNERLRPTMKLPDKFHQSGPCIPGVFKLFINVDGNFYPCERVSELSSVANIGNIYKGFDIEKIKEILNIGKISSEQCTNCWNIRNCSICIAEIDSLTHISTQMKSIACEKSKTTTQELLKDYCVLSELGYDFQSPRNSI